MKVTAIIEKGPDGTYDVRMSQGNLDFLLLGGGNTVALALEDF